MKIIIFGLNNTGEKIYQKLKSKKKYKLLLILKKNVQIKKIKNFNPDFIFSLGYRKKIKQEILDFAKIGSFNIHKSLLPYHSGANPVFWTIFKNTKAGHTIHRMTNKIDAGNIIMQREVKYNFDDDAKKLYEKIERQQIKDFFIFLNNYSYYLKREKKNFFNKKFYKYKDDFKKFKIINYFTQNKYYKTINLLRALNFKPFHNINFKFKDKIYTLKIDIKKINKIKKRNFKKLKEY